MPNESIDTIEKTMSEFICFIMKKTFIFLSDGFYIQTLKLQNPDFSPYI